MFFLVEDTNTIDIFLSATLFIFIVISINEALISTLVTVSNNHSILFSVSVNHDILLYTQYDLSFVLCIPRYTPVRSDSLTGELRLSEPTDLILPGTHHILALQ